MLVIAFIAMAANRPSHIVSVKAKTGQFPVKPIDIVGKWVYNKPDGMEGGSACEQDRCSHDESKNAHVQHGHGLLCPRFDAHSFSENPLSLTR